jgi:hypothetical protein
MIGFIGLFDAQLVTAPYRSVSHTHTHTTVHSHIFTSCCSVAASNGRWSPSSRFPNYPWPLLPTSHSNSSQWLNLSSSLNNSVTHQSINLTQLTPLTDSTHFLLTILLVTSRHGPHRKHCSSFAVYGPLFICLFRGLCLATCLRSTIHTHKQITNQWSHRDLNIFPFQTDFWLTQRSEHFSISNRFLINTSTFR